MPTPLLPKIIPPGGGKTFNVLGSPTRLLLTREESGGAITLFEQRGNPGEGVPLHVHTREDELFQVIEGRVKFVVAGKSFVAEAGSVVFGPRNIPHSWFIDGDKPGKIIFATLPGTSFEQMLEELSRLPAGPPDMAKVTEIAARAGVSFVA